MAGKYTIKKKTVYEKSQKQGPLEELQSSNETGTLTLTREVDTESGRAPRGPLYNLNLCKPHLT